MTDREQLAKILYETATPYRFHTKEKPAADLVWKARWENMAYANKLAWLHKADAAMKFMARARA